MKKDIKQIIDDYELDIDRLSDEEANILKSDNKLKLYVCEGDSVSTVFNYNELKDVSKPIYINYLGYL